MENLPKQPIEPEGQKSELQAFRDEIVTLKEEIEREKYPSGEPKVAHFSHMNIDCLTEEDMDLWRKYKTGELGLREFREYRHKVAADHRHDSHEFAAYIGNQISYWAKKMDHDK